MKVLFVTSEVASLYKLGGLGDISRSLPVALAAKGVEVTVVMPFYDKVKLPHVRCVGQIALDFNRRRELVFIFKSVIPGTVVPIFLFRHPLLMHYQTKTIAETFAFFSKAVVQFYLYSKEGLGGSFDIVHCNDWHTALIPVMLGESRKVDNLTTETMQSVRSKTILTVHNFLYQGETGVNVILKLGLSSSFFHVFTTDKGQTVKFLREGIERADVVTTVSRTYAEQVVRGLHGASIAQALAKRGDNLIGILNGIDDSLWDPRTDSRISEHYSIKNVEEQKSKIKSSLCRALKLAELNVPLFGFVGRLERRQKGVNLIVSAVKFLPKDSFQLVVLGTGPKSQVELLQKLIADHPNISFIDTFDERLARKIYAGADVMLVPSKFEPCGLTQMIAMRYGTLPLVRKTGGLADSVTDKETGFVFGPYNWRALEAKMREVCRFYQKSPRQWGQMMKRAMQQDNSWDKSAQKYLKLYQKLLN